MIIIVHDNPPNKSLNRTLRRINYYNPKPTSSELMPIHGKAQSAQNRREAL